MNQKQSAKYYIQKRLIIKKRFISNLNFTYLKKNV